MCSSDLLMRNGISLRRFGPILAWKNFMRQLNGTRNATAVLENCRRMTAKLTNLQQRILTAAVLLPLVCFLIYAGGMVFLIGVVVFLGLGAWEFHHIYLNKPDNRTSTIFMVAMVVIMCLCRYFFGFNWSWRLFTLCFMLSMVFSVVSYELGDDAAANGFSTLVTGVVYLGWLGSYLVALRQLDDGLVWVAFTVLLAISADLGAFIFGRLFGRRPSWDTPSWGTAPPWSGPPCRTNGRSARPTSLRRSS